MHLPQLIIDLAVILGLAGLVSVVFRLLKLPVVLGYIISGFLAGPSFPYLPTIKDSANIKIWGEIGVIFLLFGLGLEFSYKKLMRLGGVSLVAGTIEIFFLMFLGITVAHLLGWQPMDRLFLGGCLAISSTAVIAHSFEDLKLQGRRFASIVLGILIIEDIAAIVLLVLLSTISVTKQFEGTQMVLQLFRLGAYLIAWYVAGIFLLPSLLSKVKKWTNDETALIAGVGLCLAMAVVASFAGFSPALGAFLTGSIIAETVWSKTLENVFRPIKNFFGAVFFVSVGMLINPTLLFENAGMIVILAMVLICGKFVGVAIGVLVTGRSLRHGLQSAASMIQIGEFSFIIVGLGDSLGITSPFLSPVVLGVAVLTTMFTPFSIRSSEKIVEIVERRLPLPISKILEKYQAAIHSASIFPTWTVWLRKVMVIVLTNGIVVLMIFFGVKHWQHLISKLEVLPERFSGLIPNLIAIILAIPFFWAMAFSQPKMGSTGPSGSTPRPTPRQNASLFSAMLAIRYGLSFLLFVHLSTEFFSFVDALILSLIFSALAVLIFPKRVRRVYGWFESRFQANFDSRDEAKAGAVSALTPWDARLLELTVPDESALIGKSLEQLKIRESHGVTIVLIKRGNLVIQAPQPTEILMPRDQLSMIGLDKDLEIFHRFLTTEVALNSDLEDKNFGLLPVTITEGSVYLGKKIRDSGIRESVRGLVIGIERRGQRILNPDSSILLEKGDLVWLVGDVVKIRSHSF